MKMTTINVENTDNSSVKLSSNKSTHTYSMTRRLNLEFNGSPASYSSGGHDAATWSPQNGKLAACFGVEDCCESPSDNTVNAMLSGAILKHVKVLQVQNNLPVAIGFNCNIIPSNEVTKTGHRYALTAPAKSSTDQHVVLWENDGLNTDQELWRSKYPAYNTHNLDTEGVLTVTGQTYCFVDQEHPVIDLLRSNADVLNQNIETNGLIDGKWYKVSKQVLATCCKQLRENVLMNINTQNLAAFKGQIMRLNGKDWNSLSANDDLVQCIDPAILETKDETKIGNALKEILERRQKVTIRLELKYDMPHIE